MLSRQEGSTTRHLASAQHWTGLAGGDTGRLFLTFGGPVCADRISYCPLDRVLTYKNLIYLLNLHFIALIHLTYQTIAYAGASRSRQTKEKRRPGFHPRQDRYTTLHSPGGLVPASLARGT